MQIESFYLELSLETRVEDVTEILEMYNGCRKRHTINNPASNRRQEVKDTQNQK